MSFAPRKKQHHQDTLKQTAVSPKTEQSRARQPCEGRTCSVTGFGGLFPDDTHIPNHHLAHFDIGQFCQLYLNKARKQAKKKKALAGKSDKILKRLGGASADG